MNLFQRITTTLTSKVDSIVSHVENHDAVVDAALRETQAAAAKARVRLTRIQKDGAQMRRTLESLIQSEKTWEERAVTSAKTDEAKALECVKRRNACRVQRAHLQEALLRHEEVERDVNSSVERIEQKLQSIHQQRNQMRSRHSAADAMRVISRIEDNSASGVEDIFDRWEMLITEMEYASGAQAAVHSDSLENAFVKQEQQESLKADLAALLTTSKE